MSWRPSIPRACVWVIFSSVMLAQNPPPQVLEISPTAGPEGSRVEILGNHLQEASTVLFGKSSATFKVISAGKLIALVPRWTSEDRIVVRTPSGQATSPIAFVVRNDPRVPDDVGWKSGYVNPAPPPWPFHSVLLWGIAIADTRVPGYESAQVEVASTQLSCRVNGEDVNLNNDAGQASRRPLPAPPVVRLWQFS